MAKEKREEPVVAVAKAVSKRCPEHGVRLVHMEVDGLMGWQCPVEGCPVFDPDPVA